MPTYTVRDEEHAVSHHDLDQVSAVEKLHELGVYPVAVEHDLCGTYAEGRVEVFRRDDAFISVLTHGTRESVMAYLYSGMTVLHVDDDAGGRGWTAMIIQANSHSAAQYQADRLASGLIGAKVHDTQAQAADHIATII